MTATSHLPGKRLLSESSHFVKKNRETLHLGKIFPSVWKNFSERGRTFYRVSFVPVGANRVIHRLENR